MIHIQLISREGANLQKVIRDAIADGSIRSFEVSRVHGGLKIRHKKHPGEIQFEKTKGPVIATVVSKSGKEWQLLEAFVGRIAYHFPDEIAGMNIQMDRE